MLAILTLVFWNRIQDHKGIYQIKKDHYEAISNNLRPFKEGKFIFSSFNYPHEITMMTWPGFAESLLFSGLEGPDAAYTFFVAQEYDYDWIRQVEKPNELLLDYPWDPVSAQSDLPPEYFMIPELPYKITNEAKPVSGDSMLTLLSRSSIEWMDIYPGFTGGTRPYCKLRFKNKGPDPIPSTRMGDNSVFLTYRYYFKGEMVEWYPPKVPLLMDIHSQMEQMVKIEIPEQKEEIELQFGLVGYNGEKMYLKSRKYPIRVQ